MNLSATMICPKCGNDMKMGGCRIGGTVTTYNRVCDCGMAIMCVPMREEYRYTISLSNEVIEEKRREAREKVNECQKALDQAKRELSNI